MEEDEVGSQKQNSLIQKLRQYLMEDSESGPNPRYKRKLLDNRIEKYLDENFASFVDEYELLTNVDTLASEERYDELAYRVENSKQFQDDSNKKLEDIEQRISRLRK